MRAFVDAARWMVGYFRASLDLTGLEAHDDHGRPANYIITGGYDFMPVRPCGPCCLVLYCTVPRHQLSIIPTPLLSLVWFGLSSFVSRLSSLISIPLDPTPCQSCPALPCPTLPNPTLTYPALSLSTLTPPRQRYNASDAGPRSVPS